MCQKNEQLNEERLEYQKERIAMGLIYSSSDSEVIKSSLATNLSIARTAISNLNSGSQQLIDDRWPDISGRVYREERVIFRVSDSNNQTCFECSR